MTTVLALELGMGLEWKPRYRTLGVKLWCGNQEGSCGQILLDEHTEESSYLTEVPENRTHPLMPSVDL